MPGARGARRASVVVSLTRSTRGVDDGVRQYQLCARLCAHAARRINETAGPSIAQFGERLGVGQARAADMLRVTAAHEPEPVGDRSAGCGS